MSKNKEELKKELERLTSELNDAKASLPAHTVRPHQIKVIEDLEDKIEKIKQGIESD